MFNGKTLENVMFNNYLELPEGNQLRAAGSGTNYYSLICSILIPVVQFTQRNPTKHILFLFTKDPITVAHYIIYVYTHIMYIRIYIYIP